MLTVIATGPLTSAPLVEAIRALTGQDSLYFFDAMAPIVIAASVDMEIAWRGNRWEHGSASTRSGGAEEQGSAGRNRAVTMSGGLSFFLST